MIGFLLRVLIVMAGLWLASVLVPGIQIRDGWTLLFAALVLGVVNAIVRPLIVILTLPITILTLGLFLLVINAAMLGLVASLFRQLPYIGLLGGATRLGDRQHHRLDRVVVHRAARPHRRRRGAAGPVVDSAQPENRLSRALTSATTVSLTGVATPALAPRRGIDPLMASISQRRRAR